MQDCMSRADPQVANRLCVGDRAGTDADWPDGAGIRVLCASDNTMPQPANPSSSPDAVTTWSPMARSSTATSPLTVRINVPSVKHGIVP
jgi:hypothetical protein